jgi:ABC-type sulfate transport system permease subunit
MRALPPLLIARSRCPNTIFGIVCALAIVRRFEGKGLVNLVDRRAVVVVGLAYFLLYSRTG